MAFGIGVRYRCIGIETICQAFGRPSPLCREPRIPTSHAVSVTDGLSNGISLVDRVLSRDERRREREREKEEWKSIAKRASAGVTIFSTASAERIRDWERQTRENRILSPITLRYNVCGQKCLDSIVPALFILQNIYMRRDLKKKKKDPFSLLLPRPLPPSCSSWLMNKGSANRIKGEPNPPLIIFWRVSERINDRVCLWASFWKISRSISKNGNFYVNEKLNISSFVWYLSYWLLLERMMEQVEAI